MSELDVIVIHIRAEQAAEYERMFAESELPRWRDYKARGAFLSARISRVAFGTDNRPDVVKYVIAVEEYAGAFFRRYPCAYLTTPVLAWRDGPLATPREARFAARGLPRAARAPARAVPHHTACSTSPPYTSGSSGCSRSARRLNSAKPGSASCSLCAAWLGTSTAMTYLTTSGRLSVPNATREIRALKKAPRAL